MEITQLQTAKRALEDELQTAASAAVERFRNATGLSPDRINVELIDVTALGSTSPHYVVGRVEADISL